MAERFEAGRIYECAYKPPATRQVKRKVYRYRTVNGERRRKPGRPRTKKYTYKTEQNDKFPYLLVTSSDEKYTSGFNLHYFPNIRFGYPPQKYFKYNRKQWAIAYENMKRMGYFKRFIREMEKRQDQNMNEHQWRAWVKFVSTKKHLDWAMGAYRTYLTDHLRGDRVG